MSLEGPTVPSNAHRPSAPQGPPKKFAITVLSGPDAGLTRAGLDKIVIGKSVEATLQLKDEQISRAHLEIEGTFEGARVRDRGSTNGTFLAGARIQQMTVYEEATVTLGTTVLRVNVTREGSAPVTGRTAWGKCIGKSQVMQTMYSQ